MRTCEVSSCRASSVLQQDLKVLRGCFSCRFSIFYKSVLLTQSRLPEDFVTLRIRFFVLFYSQSYPTRWNGDPSLRWQRRYQIEINSRQWLCCPYTLVISECSNQSPSNWTKPIHILLALQKNHTFWFS